MPEAARLKDTTLCAYTTAHCPHPPPPDGNGKHSGSTPGIISTGSPNVFTNSRHAARVTDQTDEWTVPSCTTGTGVIISGSGTVFINGLKAARKGDTVSPHTDVLGKVTSGSHNVYIGG